MSKLENLLPIIVITIPLLIMYNTCKQENLLQNKFNDLKIKCEKSKGTIFQFKYRYGLDRTVICIKSDNLISKDTL